MRGANVLFNLNWAQIRGLEQYILEKLSRFICYSTRDSDAAKDPNATVDEIMICKVTHSHYIYLKWLPGK